MIDRNIFLFIRTELATFSCTNTRKEIYRKHQLNHQHKKSVLQELGFQLGPKGKPLVGTLPSEVFREVLANLQSGISARKMDRGGSGGRLRNVRFCLLEAKHEKDRDCIKSAATMVLLRDERFATCTRDLEVRWGTVGVMRD